MRRLITFISVAAKISIARFWKISMFPSFLVKAKVSSVMVSECLSAILNDKLKLFERIWNSWISYLTGDA